MVLRKITVIRHGKGLHARVVAMVVHKASEIKESLKSMCLGKMP